MVVSGLRMQPGIQAAEARGYKKQEKEAVGFDKTFGRCPQGIAGGLVSRGYNRVVVFSRDRALRRSLESAAGKSVNAKIMGGSWCGGRTRDKGGRLFDEK